MNAYYNPQLNEIVFPAGIVQPPFFDFQADDAINYGAMGAIIGHEMTHGFDDEGSQFDSEGRPHPKDIDGFTPEQRFYLGYAHSWAENLRPEYARMLTNVDPHPLPKFGVLGPLSNLPAFAKAFGCKAGDPMVRPPADRCGIW